MTRRAFTLIEIMVTVLVIAVLSTLAIPQFMGSFRTAALNSATDDLVTTLRYLQRTAVVQRREHRLILIPDDADTGRSLYRAEAAAVELDAPSAFLALTEGPIRPTTMPEGVWIENILGGAEAVDDAPPMVTFHPAGSADATVILITDGERTFSVLVEPNTGQVHRVDEPIHTLPNLREDLDA